MKYLLWLIFVVIIIGMVAWGITSSNVEQARYEVVESSENIEIRDYPPMIVAEVLIAENREESMNKGFRVIADYIFGNNYSAKNISMTVPVIQQKNEKIAMTAPVSQQLDGENWKISFLMPSGYSMETIPKPNNNDIKLKKIEERRFAVIRFSGLGRDDSLKTQTEKITEFIATRKLSVISSPIYAFYNPPWSIPFLRRNEVMVEIEKKQ